MDDEDVRDIEDFNREVTGRVHSIDSFTAVDGAGIRLIAFLQGCKKRCAFCCNVDSTDAAAFAPRASCGDVARVGEEMTANALLDKLQRNVGYYRNGGGITLSGGECLLQSDFVEAVARGARAMGLTTTLDTASYGDEAMWDRVLPLVDEVLLCVKSPRRVRYRAITGSLGDDEYECMRAFLSSCEKHSTPTWLRFVLMTDEDERFAAYKTNDEDELLALSRLAKSHANVRGIEILPYHQFGVYKFAELGLEYKLEGMRSPTMEEIDRAKAFIESQGVVVLC